MFEKIWILLKFWPFSVAGAKLVTGAQIAISTSPAPLFLGFWWVRHPPPPILGVGNPFLKALGCGLMVCCGHFRFFVFVACSWCLEIEKSKHDTTRDHPGPISQKYRPLPYPNPYISEKPFPRLFRKGTIHPPSGTPCSVKSTDTVRHSKTGHQNLRRPAENPQTSDSPGQNSQKYGPLPPPQPVHL